MAKETLVAGTKTRETYTGIDLDECVGKIIEAVVETWVPSSEGPERVFRLLFSDGTRHGFVVPLGEDEDRPTNAEAGLECPVCGGVDEGCTELEDGRWKCPSESEDPMNPEDLLR